LSLAVYFVVLDLKACMLTGFFFIFAIGDIPAEITTIIMDDFPQGRCFFSNALPSCGKWPSSQVVKRRGTDYNSRHFAHNG